MYSSVSTTNVALREPCRPTSAFACSSRGPRRGAQVMPASAPSVKGLSFRRLTGPHEVLVARSVAAQAAVQSEERCSVSSCEESSSRYDEAVESGEWNMWEEVSAGRLALPIALSLILPVQEAMAAGGEYGMLEKKGAALVHPIIMLVLFGATGYAGYLGWQWRSVRTVGDEISALKAQLPPKNADGEAPATPELDSQIAELTLKRKELVAGGYREKHYDFGNLLLSLGVLTSVAGGMNTYLRVGKLFPGPHLFAGVGITVLWAMAAALVPYMQKGNTLARNAHIALNCVNLGLFAWQVPTGWEIVLKVWAGVSW